MKVRTLNRVVRVGIWIFVAAFAVALIGGLIERPFALWKFASRLAPMAIFLALIPSWLKVMRDREATYGPDGTMPASYSRRLWLVLGVALLAVVLGVVLAFTAGYSHAH